MTFARAIIATTPNGKPPARAIDLSVIHAAYARAGHSRLDTQYPTARAGQTSSDIQRTLVRAGGNS